jgi:hypothetical protein
VNKDFRILHKNELCDTNKAPPSIIGIETQRKLRWARHMTKKQESKKYVQKFGGETFWKTAPGKTEGMRE